MLEMTTKVVTCSRFFLIESIGYGFRSLTSFLVLSCIRNVTLFSQYTSESYIQQTSSQKLLEDLSANRPLSSQ